MWPGDLYSYWFAFFEALKCGFKRLHKDSLGKADLEIRVWASRLFFFARERLKGNVKCASHV